MEKTFAEQLNKIMKEQNLDVLYLSKLTGISGYRLNNWLIGKSKPRVNHICILCDKLKVKADYLLGRED